MGFDTKLVNSHESHYSTFICNICQKVADLDALVTSKCSHPFCKGCLESWIPRSSTCPTCDIPIVGIKYGDGIPCQTCRQQEGEIYPLSESQPLAFDSMSKIQVTCPHCTAWEGDYGKLAEHEETCKHKQFSKPKRNRRASNESPMYVPDRSRSPRRATMDHYGSTSPIRGGKQDMYGGEMSGMYNDSVDDDDIYPSRASGAYSPTPSGSDSSSRQQAARRRVSNERELVRPSLDMDEGGSRHRPRRSASNDREYSQPESIPEEKIAFSEMQGHDDGGGHSGRRARSGARSPVRVPSRMDDELPPQEEYTDELNDSMAGSNGSAGGGGGSGSGSGGGSGSGKRTGKARKQRQKDVSTANALKEKANARFNKGDLVEAKTLYTQALNIFPENRPTSVEEKQVIATLFCNRGATSFREKDHEACILDCEAAIHLVPDYAKAYTRKWRALVALGRISSARNLLENAVQMMPREKALQDDLQKTRQIMDIHANVRRLYQKRNYVGAKDAVDNQLLVVTENPEALLLAAEVDACNGLVEVGLERCETVLKTDPNSAKAYLVKGYITFLTGLMDSGLALMKEATRIEPDSVDIREMLKRGRNVHKDYMDGRSMAASGRADSSKSQLKRAMDIFSGILEDEASFVPPKTPLYSLFLTERAEAGLYAQYYQAALSDARVAIDTKEDNLRAWIVKAHAFIALGRAREARDELKLARRTPWGQHNEQLKEVYSKADFEARVNEADQELRTMVAESRGGRAAADDSMGQSSHDMSRSGHRTNRRGSDFSNDISSASGSNNSGHLGRQRRRQSMTPAEERRRSAVIVDQERQEMLNEIKRQTMERLETYELDESGNSYPSAPPANRQDVLRQIRTMASSGSDLKNSPRNPTKNREDVLKQIRRRKTMNEYDHDYRDTRLGRKERQRRRQSALGDTELQYEEAELKQQHQHQQQQQQQRGGGQRRSRPVMSEADIRRRMSAI